MGDPFPGSPGEARAPSLPGLSSGGGESEGWGTSGGRVGEDPSDGSLRGTGAPLAVAYARRAHSLCYPPPARQLWEGAPRLAQPQSRPHRLTETLEPPSCSVDALAVVSLGFTERQQPLVVTVAKRRQQPARAGVTGLVVATPTLQLTQQRLSAARSVPAAAHIAQGPLHPSPAVCTAAGATEIRLQEGGIHSSQLPVHFWRSSQVRAHRWSATPGRVTQMGGYSLASALRL